MKKIVKYTFIVLLCIIIGALIIRTVIYSDKTVFDEFEITDASRAAYAAAELLMCLRLRTRTKAPRTVIFVRIPCIM